MCDYVDGYVDYEDHDDDHDDDGDASGSFCLLRALFVCSKAKFHF